MSWRAGNGRREWVSMGCLGWLIVTPFVFAWYAVYAVGWLLWQLARGLVLGVAWLVREARRPTT